MVQEYQKRKKDIARLTVDLQKKDEAVRHHQEEIEEIKARWLDPLKELIQRINENFSFFFKSMKCAGEVDLNIPEQIVSVSKCSSRTKLNYQVIIMTIY